MPSQQISIGNQTFQVREYDYDYDDEEGGGGSNKNPMVEVLEKFNDDYPKYMDGLVDFSNLVGYIDQIRYCVFALTVLGYVAVITYLVIHCYYSKKNCEKWLKNAIMKRELELRRMIVKVNPAAKEPASRTAPPGLGAQSSNHYNPSMNSLNRRDPVFTNVSLLSNNHPLLANDHSSLLATANHHPVHTSRDTDTSLTLSYLVDEESGTRGSPKPGIPLATTTVGSPKVGARASGRAGGPPKGGSLPRSLMTRWETEGVDPSEIKPGSRSDYSMTGSGSGPLPRKKLIHELD